MEQTGGAWNENIFDLIKENDIESIRSMVETFGKGMDDEGMDDEGIYDEGMDDEGIDDEFNKINGKEKDHYTWQYFKYNQMKLLVIMKYVNY